MASSWEVCEVCAAVCADIDKHLDWHRDRGDL